MSVLSCRNCSCMVAIVRIALRRPYTFVVMALLILIIGPLAALRTPVDIFPDIRIPVIAVIWNYTGLPPDQMAGRIVTQFSARAHHHRQRHRAHRGDVVQRAWHHQGLLPAERRYPHRQRAGDAVMQTTLKQMPPNTTPPLILNYNASTVPIIQLALSGSGLSEQTLADIGLNVVRTPLVTVPGAAIPFPYGGKTRQVQIDLDSAAMQARGLSGQDVANALAGAEPDHARRHAEDRDVRIHDPAQQRPVGHLRAWATCRSRPSTAPWSMCATWRTCATATRRRPTSCTSKAAARC